MQHPPATISVGDRLSKDEIEAVFDTGFGYQISGINLRRDDDDGRYVLLFAKDDGPYADDVSAGQFEYVGEGQTGDQSETSQGNAVLIDAISTNIPIHFFHKREDDLDWRYQGLVDVHDYRFEPRDGRDVLVFEMEHVEWEPGFDGPGLYLVPVSHDWHAEFERTVRTPLDISQFEQVPSQLDGASSLRIWATTSTDATKKQDAIRRMASGDHVLFYHDGDFVAGGRVSRAFESSEVGELVWNEPSSRHVYTLQEYTERVPPIGRVWNRLGYEGRQVVQGFTRVAEKRIHSLTERFGSLEAALYGDVEKPMPDDVAAERVTIEGRLDEPPELTEPSTYTERKQRARSSVFRELVRDVYDETCAVCGRRRESPDGDPEVEAAHIYPKHENGRDDVRNGLALCRLHHWALDAGWLAFSNEYEILVRSAPERDGYHEFKQLEGRTLRVPDDETVAPDPLFLGAHRRFAGFEV